MKTYTATRNVDGRLFVMEHVHFRSAVVEYVHELGPGRVRRRLRYVNARALPSGDASRYASEALDTLLAAWRTSSPPAYVNIYASRRDGRQRRGALVLSRLAADVANARSACRRVALLSVQPKTPCAVSYFGG